MEFFYLECTIEIHFKRSNCFSIEIHFSSFCSGFHQRFLSPWWICDITNAFFPLYSELANRLAAAIVTDTILHEEICKYLIKTLQQNFLK